jgi:hypothetical protein
MRFCTIILLFSMFCLPVVAKAQEGLLFGPEWTFTGPGIMDSASINTTAWQMLQRFSKQIMGKCSSCQISTTFPEIDIRINSEVTISLTLDNRVIEINSTPMTTSMMETHKDLLQELIWNSAKEIGLAPHVRLGGGHLHIQKPYQPALNPIMSVQRPYSWIHRLFTSAPEFEYSTMRESPDILLMRNFIVDLWNRPALFLGALGFNLRSAKPLSAYSPTALELIQHKVLEFDRGEIGIESLIRYHNMILSPSGDSRNLAINLEHARTIEIRGLRPQQSFLDYIKLCQLFEARIRALSQQQPRSSLKLEIPVVKTWINKIDGQNIFLSSLSDEDVNREFRKYVEAANLDWGKYNHFPLATPKTSLRCVNLF